MNWRANGFFWILKLLSIKISNNKIHYSFNFFYCYLKLTISFYSKLSNYSFKFKLFLRGSFIKLARNIFKVFYTDPSAYRFPTIFSYAVYIFIFCINILYQYFFQFSSKYQVFQSVCAFLRQEVLNRKTELELKLFSTYTIFWQCNMEKCRLLFSPIYVKR